MLARMVRFWRFLLPVFATLVLIGAGPDSYTVDELEKLEAERQAAIAKLEALEQTKSGAGLDLAKLDALLLSAAQERIRREDQAATARQRLKDLRARYASSQAALYQDETALEQLMGALMAANLAQPPALVASPENANKAVRASVLMANVAPELAARTRTLRDELEDLRKLDREIQREQARLDTAQAVLDLKRAEIEQLAQAKRSQFEDVAADTEALRQQVAALSAEANTLRELLTSLEETAPTAPTRKPRPVYASASPPQSLPRSAPSELHPLGPQALGGFQRPVTGLIAEAFGKRRASGETAKGITILTQPEAQVIAPVDGEIVFADSFRSYGPSLILHTSDDYYVLLSGLGAIYGTVSQTVTAGEPVGHMSADPSPAPQLYFELIKNDNSVDPARWMKRGG